MLVSGGPVSSAPVSSLPQVKASGGGANTYTQALDFSATTSELISKAVRKGLTFGPTTSETIGKAVGKSLAFSPSSSETVSKSVGKALAFSPSSSSTVGKACGKILGFGPSSVTTIGKACAKALAFAPSTVSTIGKAIGKTLGFSVSTATSLAEQIVHTYSQVLNFTAQTVATLLAVFIAPRTSGTWTESARNLIWTEQARPIAWTESARQTTWTGSADVPIATTLIETPDEVRLYGFNFALFPEIVAGDTIASVVSITQVAGDNLLTVGAASISGDEVLALLSTGTAGVVYVLKCKIMTAAGRVLTCGGRLLVESYS